MPLFKFESASRLATQNVTMTIQRLFCVLFACSCCVICQTATNSRLVGISSQISSFLLSRFENETSFESLNQVYLNHTNSNNTTVFNGTTLVDLLAERMRQKFVLVDSLLQDSLSVTEGGYLSRLQSDCCACLHNNSNSESATCKTECKGTSYFRSTVDGVMGSGANDTGSINNETLEQQYSELFGRNVSFNKSALHVPVDIYDRDPKLACFVDWTDNLTSHFTSQRQKRISDEDGITYQFFGGTLGAMRFYPGSAWAVLNQCRRCPLPPADIYHATQRPWYVNTVPGSKFVVIILDLSGSMAGFRLLLAQLAAKQLLESLTANDFFYVIGSHSSDTSPLNCSQRMTRATPENVLAITEVIIQYSNQNLTGQDDFSTAIPLAFDQFNSSVSVCHKSIVVFTDRDSDNLGLENALDKFNIEKEVRVFIYLVGRSNGGSQLGGIACENGGRMFHIENYNDVSEKVMGFSDHLRSLTPPGMSRESVFWNQYRDVFGDYVLTGSLPLILDNGNGSSTFLGVMGIDLKLTWVEQFLSQLNMVDDYYWFMIDNNGEVLFHPELDQDFIKTMSSDDLLRLDISQFEHAYNSSDFQTVRKFMIDRDTGEFSMAAWIPIERERRYVLRNVTYYYKPVEDTPFSIAIVTVTNEATSGDRHMINVTRVVSELQSEVDSKGLELGENVFLQFASGQTTCLSVQCLQNPSNNCLHLISTSTHKLHIYAGSTKTVALRALNTSSNVESPTSVLGTVFNTGSLFLNDLSDHLTNDMNETVLYLLDSSGYIITSDRGDASGDHFSVLYPSVFSAMVSNGVYNEGVIRGYELQPCPVQFTGEFTGCVDNAGFSIYKGILISLYHWMMYCLNGGMWLLAKTTVFSILTSIQSLFIVSGENTPVTLTGMMMSLRNTSCPVDLCLRQFVAHELRDSFVSLENQTVQCMSTSEIVYEARAVEGTNLLLVSITDAGNCSDWSDRQNKAYYQLPCVCDRASWEDYANRSVVDGVCHSDRSIDNSSSCTSTSDSLSTTNNGPIVRR